MRFLLLLAGASLLPRTANAATILLSAGDRVLYNFDMRRENPPPPYPRVYIQGAVCCEGGESTWRFFDGLDGSGEIVDTFTNTNLGTWSTYRPGIVDGIFSLSISVSQGSIGVDLYAIGVLDNGVTERVLPTLSDQNEDTDSDGGMSAVMKAILIERARNKGESP